MKKVLAVMLALIVIFHISCFSAFADDKKAAEIDAKEKGLVETKSSVPDKEIVEKYISLVKSKINVPEDYTEFYSEANSFPLRFRWSTKSSDYYMNSGSIEVTVNENGSIMTYNQYRYDRNYEYQRRLPKISKEKCIEIAKKFIYYLCPEIVGEISFESGLTNYTLEYDGNYRFLFYRQHNNIPFYDNGVSVLVNGRTGEIQELNRSWKDGVRFPESSSVIKLEEAQRLFMDKLPLVLKYGRTYGEDNDRTYLQYIPEISDINSSIDANTGEKIIESQTNNLYSEARNAIESQRQQGYGYTRDINLPEKELNDLIKSEGLVSFDKAENIIRSMDEIGIDKSYNLNRSSYCTYEDVKTYLVRLDFNKALSMEDMPKDIPAEKLKVMIAAGEGVKNASVVLNAKTGELVSINTYGNLGMGGAGEEKYNKDKLRDAVETFLKKYKSDKFNSSVLSSQSSVISEYMMKYQGVYSGGQNGFAYVRKVNGIPFDDNFISISCDSSTGKINSYTEIWDNIEFTDQSHSIGSQKASEALFKNNSLRLKYAIDQRSGEVRLVYTLDPKKPACVDGKNGVLIGYFTDKPFRETGVFKYADIMDSPVRAQIEAVFETGILPSEENFRPGDGILQKEWLYMINRMRNGYNPVAWTGELKQREMDNMYRMLINEGIMDENEKNPDSFISREEAVKYLLNAIGYKKFAAIEGIFNCDFKDKGEINPKLIGYISIAKGLGLIGMDSSAFMPKKGLTRADGVVMIYNYLMK